jgi:hypothetical protein
MEKKDDSALPAVQVKEGADLVYQAITTRKALENVSNSEPRKNVADLGLARVTFVCLENGILRTYIRIVSAQTVPAVIALLEDGEIG